MPTRHKKTVLSARRVEAVKQRLDHILAQHDQTASVSRDPVAFPRRYSTFEDQELAAFYAGFLAFGRVDLFREVLDAWFAWMDARGGPHAATLHFEADAAQALQPLYYRWIRGPHLIHLMLATRQLLEAHQRIEALFSGRGDVRARLTRACDAWRTALVQTSSAAGDPVSGPDALPRSLRYLLATPTTGSACKRWNMVLRWLVRPDEGVDLGLWTCIRPGQLIMPVDVHVLRMSQHLGLTRRPDASWRTAEEITRNLRRLDPDDPVRYDFAIAHLGITEGLSEPPSAPLP